MVSLLAVTVPLRMDVALMSVLIIVLLLLKSIGPSVSVGLISKTFFETSDAVFLKYIETKISSVSESRLVTMSPE